MRRFGCVSNDLCSSRKKSTVYLSRIILSYTVRCKLTRTSGSPSIDKERMHRSGSIKRMKAPEHTLPSQAVIKHGP